VTATSPYLANSDTVLTQLHAGSFTVAFWFRSKATGSFVPATLFAAPAWKGGLNSDGTLRFTIRNSPASVETTVLTGAVVDDWNFVVLRYDLSAHTLTAYLNGVASSAAFTYPADSTAASYAADFRLGYSDRVNSGSGTAAFDLDAVSVWARALSDAELELLYNDGDGSDYPFVGGAFKMVFQANLINNPATPLVLGSTKALWAATRLYNSETQTFEAFLDLLYYGTEASTGYTWSADNFYDKIVFAHRDNRAQYWTPPLPNVAHDLPGLPTSDAAWDGVAGFAGHVLLWRDDRLKWSAKDDFSLYLPVSATAVSTSLKLKSDFVQPPAGGTVSVTVENPVAEVKSISLQGDLAFTDTLVGESATALLTVVNTGTAELNVTGLSLPEGFAGDYVGSVPVNGSQGVVITFTPAKAVSYDGVVTVASDATTGTTVFPVSGTGTGATKIVSLSGLLVFGGCQTGHTITSALTITNDGNTTLTVSSVTLPSGFAGSFSGTIAAGAKQNVLITFSPTAALAYAGSLRVISDATSGTAVITVSGTGVSSLSAATVFLTDRGTCQFGNVASGDTVTGTLRIGNPSSKSIKVVGLSLPAGFSGAYAGTIAARTYVDVTVSFSPIAAKDYSGLVTVAFSKAVVGTATIIISGTGTEVGKILSLSGALSFGEVPVNGSVQSMLRIQNKGTTALAVSSISYPSGFSGAYAGTVAPGTTKTVLVTFAPTAASSYSGNLTVNSDADSGTDTFPLSGVGFNVAQPAALVADQFVSLEDVRSSQTFYNFYTVVSMSNTSLVLRLMDLTGATPSGTTLPADGRQFFTVDANEAGETRVVGARMNGSILRVMSQGDYAYIFKERSIQSLQYVGLGSGTFFVHNEVSGEGLIARPAIVDRQDGTLVFLGHRELYAYQGGPNLVSVCQQATRQLYRELDRTRLDDIRLFHNENRKEVWVQYPVSGGFRVLIWNYVEDSASFDDYKPEVLFTGLGLVDWSSDVVWEQLAEATTWDSLDSNLDWNELVSGSVDHVPLLASADGNLRLHGMTYSRDGEGYLSVSETMDFDLGEPDVWKYVDVVVLGLDVKQPDTVSRLMTVQVGTQASLSGADITWTAPQQVLVNGKAPVPVKVNPGGAGRYLRLRFSSADADVQWRVSSFEIHCRPGGFY
jgi:hypothetical protein